MHKGRDILERAVRTVAEQAGKADELVDEALDAGLDGSHPLTVHAKMLRLELLNVKADLERELERMVLDWLTVRSYRTLGPRARRFDRSLVTSRTCAAR